MTIRLDDILLVQGPLDRIQHIGEKAGLFISETVPTELYALGERLFTVTIPETSTLVGTVDCRESDCRCLWVDSARNRPERVRRV